MGLGIGRQKMALIVKGLTVSALSTIYPPERATL
jgi:hypothetical protein